MPCSAASAGSSESRPERPARPRPWGCWPRVRGAAALALLLAGCGLHQRPDTDPLRLKGRLRRWPPVSWDDPCDHVTPTCRVRTTTNSDVAEYVAAVLQLERTAFLRLWGVAPARQLSVRVFRSREEMRAALPGLALTKTTGGLSDLASCEILLAYERLAGRHPCSVLLHEGAHQYLAECFDFRVPDRWRSAVAATNLQSVPWWLHEGLAAYMECATASAYGLRTGDLNRGRWRELRALIRRRRCPSLHAVLAATPLDLNRSPFYAVAWGLVHVLLESGEAGPSASDRQHRMLRYLRLCRNGFWNSGATAGFARELTVDGALIDGFQRKWHKRVAERSTREFQRTFLPPEEALEEWEARWQRAICRLKY